MSNLFVSLINSGNAMRAFERGVTVVQNNVTNANTPGYAKQRVLYESLRFMPETGLAGGVRAAGILDSRSAAAEEGVRRQLYGFGEAGETVRQLERLEPVMSVAANSGLGAALNQFFQSVSALTVSPNDVAARRVALERAGSVAQAFQGTAQQLALAAGQAGTDLHQTVERLNALTGELAQVNHHLKQDYRAQQDPGLAARLNTLLEQLSEITQVTVLRAEDGSVSVYAGGQVPLLIGARQFALTAVSAGGQLSIHNSDGEDITARLGPGRGQAILRFHNETLAEIQRSVDRLAQSFADEVNTQLSAGLDQTGQPPAQPLFVYDPLNGVARTLRAAALAPQDLALAAAGAPGGNGNALELAALGAKRPLDGYTFAQYYGTIAAGAGRNLDHARQRLATQESLLAQARELRQELQGVSLDEEALLLMQYQRAYEATAQLVRVLDEMLQSAFHMLR